VAAVAENTDLLSGSQDDEAIEQALADRLLALDLPDGAKPVLEKLMNQATSATAKARFGVSVATLNAREGDNAGAISALDASEGPDLPADLIEQRLILRAVTVAGLGDSAGAAAMLASTRTIQATQTRAQILENASDWTAAEQAWSDCAALTVSGTGTLDEAQTRTILHLATVTARGGDEGKLARLRDQFGPRIAASPLGDMFSLLTAEPIRTTADIERSQHEVNLAASLPAGLKAVKPGEVTH
jgi:hypothetical protein